MGEQEPQASGGYKEWKKDEKGVRIRPRIDKEKATSVNGLSDMLFWEGRVNVDADV